MKTNIVIIVAIICGIHFMLTSCEDNSFTVQEPVANSGVNSITTERPSGGLRDLHKNDKAPYPEIIQQTHVSQNPPIQNSHSKSLPRYQSCFLDPTGY